MSASKPSGSATTGASDLSRAPIDLLSLRNDAKGELMDILDLEASKVDEDSDADSDGGGGAADGRGSAQANTCLVLDPRLGGALTLVVTEGPKLFKKHGVKDMIELSWVPLATSCSTVVYLVRPEIDNMKMVGRIFSLHRVCVLDESSFMYRCKQSCSKFPLILRLPPTRVLSLRNTLVNLVNLNLDP